MTQSHNDARGWAKDDEADSPEVEAMAAVSDLVEQGEYGDILAAQEMAAEIVQEETDDLGDLPGVDARQMISARAAADAALVSGDVDALTAALDQMGVPTEDWIPGLARALLAASPMVQRRQLDHIEVLNTVAYDQAAVLRHQRARTAREPNLDGSAPDHPARVAAATVDRPTNATEQRNRPDIADRADVVLRSPNPRSANPDRRSTPRR
jgi:hypothetical protein